MGYSLMSGDIAVTQRMLDEEKFFSPLETLVMNLLLHDEFASKVFAGIYFLPEVGEYLLEHHRYDPLSYLESFERYENDCQDVYCMNFDYVTHAYALIYTIASIEEREHLKDLYRFYNDESKRLYDLGEPLRYFEVFMSLYMPQWATHIRNDQTLLSLLDKLTEKQIEELHHWQQIVKDSITPWLNEKVERLKKQKEMLTVFESRAQEVDSIFSDVETND